MEKRITEINNIARTWRKPQKIGGFGVNWLRAYIQLVDKRQKKKRSCWLFSLIIGMYLFEFDTLPSCMNTAMHFTTTTKVILGKLFW